MTGGRVRRGKPAHGVVCRPYWRWDWCEAEESTSRVPALARSFDQLAAVYGPVWVVGGEPVGPVAVAAVHGDGVAVSGDEDAGYAFDLDQFFTELGDRLCRSAEFDGDESVWITALYETHRHGSGVCVGDVELDHRGRGTRGGDGGAGVARTDRQ